MHPSILYEEAAEDLPPGVQRFPDRARAKKPAPQAYWIVTQAPTPGEPMPNGQPATRYTQERRARRVAREVYQLRGVHPSILYEDAAEDLPPGVQRLPQRADWRKAVSWEAYQMRGTHPVILYEELAEELPPGVQVWARRLVRRRAAREAYQILINPEPFFSEEALVALHNGRALLLLMGWQSIGRPK